MLKATERISKQTLKTKQVMFESLYVGIREKPLFFKFLLNFFTIFSFSEEPQSFNIIKRPKSSTSLTKTNSITSERSSRNETRYSSPLPRSKSAASLSNSSYRKRTKKFQRSNTPTRAYKRSNYTDHHIGYFQTLIVFQVYFREIVLIYFYYRTSKISKICFSVTKT